MSLKTLTSLGSGAFGGGTRGSLRFQLLPADAAKLKNLGLNPDSFKLALTPETVRSTEELDSYLPGYRRFPFRADEIAPVLLTDHGVDDYRIYDMANVFRRVRAETSLQSPVMEIDPETTLATYRARPYALGGFIPAMTRAQATGSVDPEELVGRRIADALGLDREIRMMTLATTLNNWATSARTTLTSDYKWNGGTLSDPILDLTTRIDASTQIVTDIYMGQKTAHAFLRHPKVTDHIAAALGHGPRPTGMVDAAGGGAFGRTMDFDIPGLPTIHVVQSKQLNDTTGLLDELIGGHVFMVSNPAGSAQFEDIRTFQTFRVKGPSGTGWQSRVYEDPARGRDGGDMVVSGYDEVIVMISNSSGGLIRDAWAA